MCTTVLPESSIDPDNARSDLLLADLLPLQLSRWEACKILQSSRSPKVILRSDKPPSPIQPADERCSFSPPVLGSQAVHS